MSGFKSFLQLVHSEPPRDINIGNPPDVQPDVGGVVAIPEEDYQRQTPPPVPQPIKATTERKKKMTKAAAKKAKKSAAKKAKTIAKSTKAAPVKREPIKMSPKIEALVAPFNPREGTIRKSLLIALCSSLNKPCKEADLQIALYAEINEASKAALGMCLKGVATMIAKEKLKYELVRGKDVDGNTTICLKAK